MKKIYRVLFIMAIFLIIIMIAHSTKAIDTDRYTDIYTDPGASEIEDLGSKVLGIVEVVAAGVAIIMVTVVGIKYILASPNEKADLKGNLIMITIGAILIFGGARILTWIISSFNDALT